MQDGEMLIWRMLNFKIEKVSRAAKNRINIICNYPAA